MHTEFYLTFHEKIFDKIPRYHGIVAKNPSISRVNKILLEYYTLFYQIIQRKLSLELPFKSIEFLSNIYDFYRSWKDFWWPGQSCIMNHSIHLTDYLGTISFLVWSFCRGVLTPRLKIEILYYRNISENIYFNYWFLN